MGDAIDGDGFDARIAEHDLFAAFRGRVAVEGRIDIAAEPLLQLGKPADESLGKR